jgi:L,D-peptidoglycan transpeptidase YkuD (ErfK/YbiS/YcfS/YnhG family)
MAFLFRKRLKILPGIWLNLSKSGVSTSFGGKGLTVNIKDGKTKTTVGIPGTGLSYRQLPTSRREPPRSTQVVVFSAWAWRFRSMIA